jgi:apolipoprotein N-acyltransferase
MLGLSFLPDTRHSGLAVVAIALSIRLLQQSTSPLMAGFLNTVIGMIAAGLSGFWLPATLRGLGSSETESYTGFVLIALACSLPIHFTTGFTIRAVGRREPILQLLVISGVIFASESFMTGLPGFVPWLLWGHTAADDSGLAQLASIGGVPCVSAMLGAGAWAVAAGFDARGPRALRLPTAIICGVLALSGLGLPFAKGLAGLETLERESTRIWAIQPGLPRSERMRHSLQEVNEARLLRYSRGVVRAKGRSSGIDDHRRKSEKQHRRIGTEVVVWPEGGLLGEDDFEESSERGGELARMLGSSLILGIASSPSSHPHRTRWNAVVAYRSDGTRLGFFHKYAGVPVIESESRNFLETWVASALGPPAAGTKIRESKELAPLEGGAGSIVTLCYEILLPYVVEARRPREATVILNLADDSSVDSEIATRQLTDLARFRAIEQRLPLVRIAHGGLSASFDPFGEPLAKLPLNRFGTITIDVSTARQPGPWSSAGLLALPIGSSLFAWSLYPLLLRLEPIRIAPHT